MIEDVTDDVRALIRSMQQNPGAYSSPAMLKKVITALISLSEWRCDWDCDHCRQGDEDE